MKDIYPMWKMCYVFRMRERSRNTDHIRDELINKGILGENLENLIVIERSKAKKYGILKEDATGAYVFHYYPSLRSNDGTDTVSVQKVRETNPEVSDEAENALDNCIQSGYISEQGDRVFLESGRMFADRPYFHNPFSCNPEEKINIRLVTEYVRLLNSFWGFIGFIITTVVAYYLGTLK